MDSDCREEGLSGRIEFSKMHDIGEELLEHTANESELHSADSEECPPCVSELECGRDDDGIEDGAHGIATVIEELAQSGTGIGATCLFSIDGIESLIPEHADGTDEEDPRWNGTFELGTEPDHEREMEDNAQKAQKCHQIRCHPGREECDGPIPEGLEIGGQQRVICGLVFVLEEGVSSAWADVWHFGGREEPVRDSRLCRGKC